MPAADTYMYLTNPEHESTPQSCSAVAALTSGGDDIAGRMAGWLAGWLLEASNHHKIYRILDL